MIRTIVGTAAQEMRDVSRMLRREAEAHVAQRFDPLLTNAETFRRTGNEPVVYVTGFLATRDLNLAVKRYSKERRGVPLYLVNTGVGHNTVEQNAENVVRSVRRALAETGASGVHLVGHSKGGKDSLEAMALMQALEGEQLLGKVRSLTTLGTPHRGGLDFGDGVNNAARGVLGVVGRVLPGVRAAEQLIPGSSELARKEAQLAALLDATAPDFRMYMFHSPKDLLVDPDSAALKGFDHPKLVRIDLAGGDMISHSVLHHNPVVNEHFKEIFVQNEDRTRAFIEARALRRDDPLDPRAI